MNLKLENSCNVSNFARKQLEKYGWSEGKGLGKDGNGITKPIKVSIKLDNQGIGHNCLDAWTSMWWCDAFNAASKRIKVIETEKGVCIKSEKSQTNDSQTSLRHAKKKFVRAGANADKEEIFDVTTNTLIPNFSNCSSLNAVNMKYDKLKIKAPLKRRHIRLMEQDALYARKTKKEN
ncbi:G patch domain-containing protein 4 [Parasteatoda tepidariorum]|uniref:G patch domain-containing protein 4 n=1 Tax=Parasteatoda tepidariorum TaxID=114398 RepID=UPI00077FA422|nr:G patch domain-containing protein 4 [Parasteatoda tepidariorum]